MKIQVFLRFYTCFYCERSCRQSLCIPRQDTNQTFGLKITFFSKFLPLKTKEKCYLEKQDVFELLLSPTCRFLPRKAWRKPLFPLPAAPKTLQRKTLRCVCFFCRSIRLLRVTGRKRVYNVKWRTQKLIQRGIGGVVPVMAAAWDSCS